MVRRQQVQIEGLRATVALMRTTGGWWNEADISLKVAKLLRVLRLRHVRPNSALERVAQWVNRLTDVWLEAERASALDEEAVDRPALSQLLGLADPYQAWKARAEPELDRRSGLAEIVRGPLISIVLPVYKVTPKILAATLTSLSAQSYQDWEACIAFADPESPANLRLLQRAARRDRRFRIKVLGENFGIAGNSNAALELAHGDYIALLDHDDELPPLALSRIAAALRDQPGADFIYTDKEMISQGGERRFSPLFKPGWSPETLYSVNYLTHFNVIRADLMAAVGGWDMGVDGAQDWDLFLRATERAGCIVRAPGVAYSWRMHQGSTASGLDAKPYALAAQHRALERHAMRIGLPGVFEPHAETGFNVRWAEVQPVRVVILGTRDIAPLLTLLANLRRETTEFGGVDLLLPPTQAWSFLSGWRARFGELPAWCRVRPVLGDVPFDACLQALDEAVEAVTVFLDGTLLVHTPGALRQLAGWLYEGGPIAFASGVTVETDEKVIEAGCVLDQAGIAHPLFHGAPLRVWGLFGGALWHRNVDAASPYMLALRTRDAATALREARGADWRGAFHRICLALTQARGPQGRGVVDASARAVIAEGQGYITPAQGMIGAADRYLHPYLSISPERGIILAKGLAYAA